MSNLFKKVTAGVAAAAVAFSVVSPVIGVSADSAAADAAAALAAANVISAQTSEAGYKLGSQISRREMLKVMMNLSSVEVTDTCEGKFSDLPASDWGCKYAEAALKAGFIAANPKFRPADAVTAAEALKMVMQAKGIAKAEGVTNWADAYLQAAVEAGIVAEGTTLAAGPATRSTVFVMAASALTSTDSSDEDDLDLDLGDLIGGDDDNMDGSDETTDGNTSTDGSTVVVKSGDLEITLNPTTPSSRTLPDSAEGVEVARFDLTAGDKDISVNSVKLTRKGLGSKDAVSDVALFANGARVSKARSFNSSDDTADVALSPALVVKAGSTVTLVAKVNTKNVTSSKKFSVELSDLSTSAANVKGAKVVSNEFEVTDTAASMLTFSNDGTVSAPKLGNQQAEVLKFKVKNDTSESEDISVSEITLKEEGSIDEDTELANVALYYNGTKVADAVSNGTKYFTFKLSSPVLVKDGKSEKFVVKADIVGGASDTIDFRLDNSLDVTASASKYGFVNVEGTVTATALTVQAGEVTLVAVDPTVTDVREDKDDVILGKLKVTTKGKELELSKVKFTVQSVAGNANTVLENFELYDETNGVKYDLDAAANGNNVVLTETDLAILVKGESTFVVRADTKNNITGFDGYDFKLSLSVANDGFVLKETADDELVTDITPSTLTWKTINGQESSATVAAIVMSNSTAVVGSKAIEVLEFQLSTDNSSAVEFTEAKVTLTASGVSATSAQIAAAYLMKGTTVLDQVSGSQLASGVATFDGFKEVIARNAKANFKVAVDLVDDQTQAGKVVEATLTAVDLEDEDADDVAATGLPAASSRDLTISGVGTLAIAVDNTDTETDKVKNVLGNTTSPFVASYELTATNEAIKIKDLQLVAAGANFVNAVSEVVLYKNDKVTEIDREPVTTSTITFDNVNYVVNQGNENLYVKVITRKIGKDAAGLQTSDLSFTLQATDVEGNASGKAVTTGSGVASATSASNAFAVVPVRVSAISFVNSYAGETVKSELTNGENVVAIIAVTTDSSSNTKSLDGSSLKTELESMKLTASTDAGTGVTNLTVKKINGTVGEQTVAKGDGTTVDLSTINVDGINLFKGVSLGSDEELNNGETVYYVVKATFSGLAQSSNKFFQLKLENLDAGSTVEYSSNDSDDTETYSSTDNVTSLRIGTTSISGPSISSKY